MHTGGKLPAAIGAVQKELEVREMTRRRWCQQLPAEAAPMSQGAFPGPGA